MLFNNLIKKINSKFSSSFVPSDEDKKIFLSNHRRKFILASFSMSNKDNPSVFVSLTGLHDSSNLEVILDNKYSQFWKSIIYISKNNNNYGELNIHDLFSNKSSNINIYNLKLEEMLFSLSHKDKFENVLKDALNNSLFIFEGYNWFEILNQFKLNNIEISGGIGTKRHILSPSQYKLFLALPLLNFNMHLLGFYYHHTSYLSSSFKGDYHYNKESSINNQNYKEYPLNDDYNRSYHTSCNTNTPGVSSNGKRGGKSILSKSFIGKIPLPLNFDKRRLYSSFPEIQAKSMYFEYSPAYLNIKEIIDSNDSSLIKQERIEKFLNDSWYNFYLNKIETINPYNKDVIYLLQNNILDFRECFNTYAQNIKTNDKYLEPLFSLSIDDISSCVFKILLPIIFKGENASKTITIIDIGKCVFNKWARNKYNEIKGNEDNLMKFSEFKKSLNFSDKDFVLLGDILFDLIHKNSSIFDIEVDNSDPKDTKLFITPVYKIKKLFEKNLDVLGFKLPMLSPPVEWSSDSYGGYLYNNSIYNNSLIIPSKKSTLNTGINNDIIYNSINFMTKIPYKINNEVLSYVLEYYELLGLKKELHPETSNYFKSSYSIKNDIITHNSLYHLQKNIIGLANLYSNVNKFYFVLSLDWRGRLYCDSSYLNYQGNELSKSLIKFSNGGLIDEKGLYYLKIYGANAFGLNKKSFDDRVKWVDDNKDNVINMDINFIKKASEPFIFIAFCFEYGNYLKDPDNFVSTLPISLDASCSGFQHLSAMIGESTIAENVNLLESNPTQKPNDFYQFVLNLINKKIKDCIKEDPLYIRLSKLDLTRSIIKQSIMTIPYNVSKYGITEQLMQYFKWVKIDNNNLLKPKWHSEDSHVYISKKELHTLSIIIHGIIYEEHPKLKAFIDYLIEMAELFHILGIPLTWITPSGLEIKQHYTKTRSVRIRSKNKNNYSITIPMNKTDLKKQKGGILPNVVHSLDASNIFLMVDYLIKNYKDINILTVHDCFASSPNSIDIINKIVRYAFIMIYSDNNFMEKLHNHFIYTISSNYSIDRKDMVVIYNDKDLNIPLLPKIEDINLRENLQKAVYFIH